MPEIKRLIPFSEPQEVTSILERTLEEFGNCGVVVFHFRCYDNPRDWYPEFERSVNRSNSPLKQSVIPRKEKTEYFLDKRLRIRLVRVPEESSMASQFTPLKKLSEPARNCITYFTNHPGSFAYLLISPNLEERFYQEHKMPFGTATYFTFMAHPDQGYTVTARVKSDWRPSPPRADLQRFYKSTLERMRPVILGETSR